MIFLTMTPFVYIKPYNANIAEQSTIERRKTYGNGRYTNYVGKTQPTA